MLAKRISRQRAIDLINAGPKQPGQIFSVFVSQRNGQIKRMACRKSVTKGVTGRGAKYDPTKHGLLTVYKMAGAKSGFRSIATEGILQVQIDGQLYNVYDRPDK